MIWNYVEYKEKYSTTTRTFRGFQEGIDAMEEILKKQGPTVVKVFCFIDCFRSVYEANMLV